MESSVNLEVDESFFDHFNDKEMTLFSTQSFFNKEIDSLFDTTEFC